MLFDLRGKRGRVVKVTYLTLAILMGSSLVLFGIGSDATRELRGGDQALKRAVAAAPESQRQSVRSQLEQIRRRARAAQSQQGGAGGDALSQPPAQRQVTASG